MALITKRDKFTPTKKQPVYYSDFLASMEVYAGSKELNKITNVDSVKNSLRNIILTNKGERFFNYNFGCDIRSMLFEMADPGTESVMKTMITDAIENHEPRVRLIDVLVAAQDELNAFVVTITFATINSAEPQTLDLILTRVR
jgi:phage baseplate assembly protein W